VTALGQLLDWLREVTPAEIKAYYWAAQEIYASPWFYLGIAAIFTLEWLRPAVREQRVFSPGLLQDFLWFNLDMVFKVAALPAFAGFLHLVYDRVTGGFVLPVLALLPTLVKVAISFVLFDFLQWFHHWVRHRVKALWHFHVIHHSQRELNLFTDLRVHFAEYLAAQVLTFVPMFMLGLSPFAIVGVGVVVYPADPRQCPLQLRAAAARPGLAPVPPDPPFHRAATPGPELRCHPDGMGSRLRHAVCALR
jgi:sterol desaturase/sphingolipid hydroxylase (fatty acid hydroxylase superfamily)